MLEGRLSLTYGWGARSTRGARVTRHFNGRMFARELSPDSEQRQEIGEGRKRVSFVRGASLDAVPLLSVLLQIRTPAVIPRPRAPSSETRVGCLESRQSAVTKSDGSRAAARWRGRRGWLVDIGWKWKWKWIGLGCVECLNNPGQERAWLDGSCAGLRMFPLTALLQQDTLSSIFHTPSREHPNDTLCHCTAPRPV